MNKNDIRKRVLEYLQAEPFRAFKLKEIQRGLYIDHNDYSALRAVVHKLVDDNRLVRFKKNRFGVSKRAKEITGKIEVTAQGYGFVRQENGKDIFVGMRSMGGALHSDTVAVQIVKSEEGKSQEGQVTRIVERANPFITGVFRWGKKYGYVVPDNAKIHTDIVVFSGEELNAQEGQKVLCEIHEWEQFGHMPAGKIIRVIGFPEEPGVDVLSLIFSKNLPMDFLPDVMGQAESFPAEIPQSEINRRLDLRDTFTITIDPIDAKDFDDAISLTRLPNGHWQLGVHIADVSYYVPEKSILDREAFNRGTSVYLVDRVIPMLPERISNHLCSLEEGKTKLTMSVLLELDHRAGLKDYQICESVIHSNRRLNYQQAQEIIDNKTKDDIAPVLQEMWQVAQLLLKKRNQRGAVDFESREVQIQLNEKGEPIAIHPRQRLNAHRLIEEFMLLANETVATHAAKKLYHDFSTKIPFLYRSHEKPDFDDVQNLLQVAYLFGFTMAPPKKVVPRYFQNLAIEFSAHSAHSVLQDAILRTMKKARYTAENLGHFGLAYKNYTHFTSPIRRYPDLVVHRLLKKYDGLAKADEFPFQCEELEKIGQHCTAREIRAMEAERDSVKMKQLRFLVPQVGETFKGIIVRMMDFGFFVNLEEFMIDGLVPLQSLSDDYYKMSAGGTQCIGQATGRQFDLGQKINVRITRVDLQEQLVDFAVVE